MSRSAHGRRTAKTLHRNVRAAVIPLGNRGYITTGKKRRRGENDRRGCLIADGDREVCRAAVAVSRIEGLAVVVMIIGLIVIIVMIVVAEVVVNLVAVMIVGQFVKGEVERRNGDRAGEKKVRGGNGERAAPEQQHPVLYDRQPTPGLM